MNHQPYSSVKAAGIEWVESIPSHWDVLPLQRVGHERTESNVGMIESNLLSLSYGRIVQKDIDSNDGLLPESFETYQVVHPGDIVLRLTDLQNDKRSLRSAIVNQRGIITSAYCALCSEQIDSKFASYLFRSYDLTKVFYSMGGGLRQSLKYSDLKRLPIIVPSVSEQKQIATFLDHETAKIDALVEEQQSLIELLQEKRQAVISHAVTKGLDPSVQMKDSGVEWIGPVPQHWSVVRLRYLADISTGKFDTVDAKEDGEYPFFVRSDTVERLDQYTHDCEAVFTSGDGAGVGKIFHHYDGKFAAHQRVYIFNNFKDVMGRFFYGFLIANFYKVALEGGAKSTVDSLRRPLIANFWMTVPPIEEQKKIIQFTDAMQADFAELIEEADIAIKLLQERRSALISAAVTGKIDVRNWQKQEEKLAA